MFKLLAAALIALLVSPCVFANWQLVNDQSDVSFVSTKKSRVSEAHHFKSLNGTIDDKGNISISIALSSVETNIAIRNDRMKSMLFEIIKYPEANIKASIDPERINKMRAGDTYTDNISIKLSLHGFTKKINGNIKIIKLTNNRVMATSISPIIINADKFKLADGIEKLRKAAKLPSISTAVPVVFNLVFSK